MVHVDLGEGELALGRVGVGELREDGRDGAARRAPVRVEVDDDVRGRREQGVELGGRGGLVDPAGRLGDGTAVLEVGLVGTFSLDV